MNALARNLEAHDYLRRARPALRARRGHREWFHFFVATGAEELFVNLSVFDDLRPAATRPERARVIVLARRGGRWDGDVDDVEPAELDLRGGELAGRYGDVGLAFDGDELHLAGRLRRRDVRFDLRLTPRTYPSVATDVRVGARGHIHWLVVPHLHARGTVHALGHTAVLEGAPAYHDHNWGFFDHADFRWQWGHAQAGETAVVLSRLLDGVLGHAYVQSLFVWEGPRIGRIFRGRELTFAPRGFLRRRALTLPRLASLLARGATEVPAALDVRAASGDDALEGELVFDDAACLVLAEGAALETTLLHEVLGRLRLHGRVAGRPFALDAPVVFETMRRA